LQKKPGFLRAMRCPLRRWPKEEGPGAAFNLVGFQTRLKWKEQERIFRMIPGLEQAVFFRFGSLQGASSAFFPCFTGCSAVKD